MTTLTLDAHREQMLRWLEKGRSYEFLTMAGPYLNLCPDDSYVALMAVREYMKLGLALPAREVFDLCSPVDDASPDYLSVRESLEHIQGAPLPWSRRTQRFEANLAALERRGIDVTLLRDTWEQRSAQYQLFRDARGVHQVRRRDSMQRWEWFPMLRDHGAAEAAQPMPDGIKRHTPGPYVFEGVGFGAYLERVYEATKDTFLGFSCALFIVEPDPAALAFLLHLRDWRTILSDPRVWVCVGLDWADRLREAFEDHHDLPVPVQVFTIRAGSTNEGNGAAKIIEEVIEGRDARIQRSLADLESQYASRDVAYWAKRFAEALSGQGPTLKILAAVSTHTTFLQYSLRDAQQALQFLGHSCRVLTERHPYDILSPLTYHQAIREWNPDLFLVLDHIRPEFQGILPTNLPMLTWDQDQLPQVFTRANIVQIAKHDFLVGCSKSFLVHHGLDPKQMLQVCMPTSPERFGGAPLTDEEESRYACDVSYVSHASQTPQAFHEQERSNYADPLMRRLLDTMFELMPEVLAKHGTPHGGVTHFVLEEALQRCGITGLDESLRSRLTGWYLWRLGDRMFRHEALEWAAQWARRTGRTFRLYGNGWDTHPTLAEFAVGPAANGRELVCVYRASRINLQLMPAGFIHQRALDGLAAGGFFLTRATRHDQCGRILRRLMRRIDELNISDNSAYRVCKDEPLLALLRAFHGDWPRRPYADDYDALRGIRIAAEDVYPDEVFPRFDQIVFDSAETFAAIVDHFLRDDAARRPLVEEMRRIVVERFSYRARMDEFVRAMGTYLAEESRCPK
ncbi:MAG: glycosyltransferase family 1 protein [Planctomycetes bacterium]|nr:glycosyltransferase family 1 protein [Planctomycetota bacterium]